MATFILTNSFKKILETDEVKQELYKVGYASIDKFIDVIVMRLNEFDASLKLKEISFHYLADTDKYIGLILDEQLNKKYNVCVIPPKLGTRSGFLTQQVFGFVSNLILSNTPVGEGDCLTDKPLIVVNCMLGETLPNSSICNIVSAKILGFEYLDIFKRKESFDKKVNNLMSYYTNLKLYKDIDKDFTINENVLKFNTGRLKYLKGTLTNEPYYFAIDSYPALVLAYREGYKIDVSSFEDWYQNSKNNKNILAFVLTAKRFQMQRRTNKSLQQIFYGAPGSGKSHEVKKESDKYPDTIRTTFHPDSDYASFVGAYKPTVAMEKLYDEAGVPVKVGGQELSKNQITYKFVKQAFLKAYVKAWKKFQKAEDASHIDSQFLVIEEINRGNCAQIFGDLFQLLDRKNGFSEYPIEADEDIAKSLQDEDTPENPSFGKVGLQLAGWQKAYIENLFQKSKDKDVIVEKISMGKVLVLPCNLYIWATMNTSDQSLFPIDSAFKRRWDWKYVPINTKVKKWAIEVEDQKYSWTSFLDKMNEQIFNVTHSEDKKFGFFFCHADKKSDDTVEEEDVISAEKFVSKVIFFIYNDVFKDYGFDRKIFAGEDGKPIQFHEYYCMDGSVDESKVKKFLENVEVKPFEAEQADESQE